MKNNKGFVMTEALVISAVVLTALILIYAQFVRLDRAYSNEYTYNNVNGIYKLHQIDTFIQDEDSEYENIIEDLDGYKDLTDCSFATNEKYCEMLIDAANIKHLLVGPNSRPTILTKLNSSNPYKLKFTNFIKTIDDSDEDFGGLLIAEFKDNTYAAIPIGEGINFNVLNTSWEFAYTGNVQTFTVPANGLYQLEVWGAQGGNGGGAGGYSIGYKKLNKNDTIYVVVGGTGGSRKFIVQETAGGDFGYGGYNGGGNIQKSAAGMNSWYYGGGGGATHIATATGSLASLSSNRASILIVAGGGGGGPYGGTGGGINGGNGGKDSQRGGYFGIGATQSSGGNYQYSTVTNSCTGSFGQGGKVYGDESYQSGGGAGGGGYYGGGGASISEEANAGCGGGGGSGYIGGVPEFEYKGTTYTPSTSNGGNSGNGKAKITLIKY